MRTLSLVATAIVGWCLSIDSSGVLAADAKSVGPDAQLYQKTVDRAIQFLAARQSGDARSARRSESGPPRWLHSASCEPATPRPIRRLPRG